MKNAVFQQFLLTGSILVDRTVLHNWTGYVWITSIKARQTFTWARTGAKILAFELGNKVPDSYKQS